MPARPSMLGAVLAGGTSRRMGTDKAAIELGDGRPLLMRPVDALRGAGLDVVMVGGDRSLASAVGIEYVDDHEPPIGPVGGVVAALDAAAARGSAGVVVLPCDLPSITGTALRAWLDGVGSAPDAVAVATIDGRPQYPVGVWPLHLAGALRAAAQAGARSFDDALAHVTVVEVAAPEQFVDADTPGELAAVRYPETFRPGDE